MNTKVLLYTLAGLIVGIGLGIFLAPAAGKETFSKLRKSGKWFSKKWGIESDEEFSDSEMEMDATNGRMYGF